MLLWIIAFVLSAAYPQDWASGPVEAWINTVGTVRAWRGKGVGSALLSRLMEAARARGDREVVLAAQIHAVAFYRVHGFAEVGEEYEEAGLPHRDMRRAL